MTDQLAMDWAERFGLALSPLFGASEQDAADHYVLLDGGLGSFALSVGDAAEVALEQRSSWAWSSNLPHHVSVYRDKVFVSRWDRADVEPFTQSSVENRLDAFYSYLISDRVRSNKRVVDHLIDLFRRVRSLVAEVGASDTAATSAYLVLLAEIANPDLGVPADSGYEMHEGAEVLKRFSKQSLAALREYAQSSDILTRSLTLFPNLAIRHAGAEVFQEAHFELIRSPNSDLFGYVGPAEAKTVSRGGAHFTPPALARSLCEQTLAELGDVAARQSLTIMDLACGSGAFLHEATRTLQRLGFNGQLHLIGRDISDAAVSMARFMIRHAHQDWRPKGGLTWSIEQGDSLESDLPPADVVLMNPPFISWVAMSEAQRDQLREALGHELSGRGDYSMGFLSKALRSLAPGGVVGALMPSSLLNLESAGSWRDALLEKASLRFIASLGDHGLFAHALVSVAAVVLKVRQVGEVPTSITALVTSNTSEATGEALRAVRREDPSVSGSLYTPNWRLFSVSEAAFGSRPTWRLTSPETEAMIERVLDGGALPVDDLFDVKQGVLTGLNKAFLLSNDELGRLPEEERIYFRAATVSESISNGTISPTHVVFYPHTCDGNLFATEEEVRAAVPAYYRRYLKPNEPDLKARANITRSQRSDWWGLSERRSWALSTTPRIITKYFGESGGFAADIDAEYLVVQGYAWLPKWLTAEPEDEMGRSTEQALLYAYTALFNSSHFGQLVQAFAPTVSGGQFNLSPRYVKRIPIPDLPALMTDENSGALVLRLAELGKTPHVDAPGWNNAVDRIVGTLYGTSLTI